MKLADLRLHVMDLCLSLQTTVRGLRTEPLFFLAQVARRLGRRQPPRHQSESVRCALRWYIADRPDVAARLVAPLASARGLRGRLARRLGIELGTLTPDESDSKLVRAAALRQVGDLSGALAVAPKRSALARSLAGELRLLRPAPKEAAKRRLGAGPALLVLTSSLPHTQSGYTFRTHSLLSALANRSVAVAATTRLGYPASVGLVGTPLVSVVDPIRYRRLPTVSVPNDPGDALRQQERMLEAVAREVRPGILHCTTDYTNAIVTRALSHRLSLPWVYEMRGQLELSWVASQPASLQDAALASERVRLWRAKETELAKDADAVIVLSQVQADDLITRGVATERITVVPNGVDESTLTQCLTPTEARTRLGLPQAGFWVGSVSSLVGYEGFDLLLRAVAELRKAGADARCLLVGDGVARPQLESLASQLGIADHTVFPGRVAADASPTWYQALDVFAVPRLDTPVTRLVTPLKPMEAMSLARPIIASNLPALAELVNEPGTGLLFEPGSVAALADALTQLAFDQPLREQLGANGRSFAAGRTWQNAAEQIHRIYHGERSG